MRRHQVPAASRPIDSLAGGDEEIDQDVGATDQHRGEKATRTRTSSPRQMGVGAVRADGRDDGGEHQARHTGDEPDRQQRAHHVGQSADTGQAVEIREHIGNDAEPTTPMAVMVVTMCVPSSELDAVSGPLCPSLNSDTATVGPIGLMRDTGSSEVADPEGCRSEVGPGRTMTPCSGRWPRSTSPSPM